MTVVSTLLSRRELIFGASLAGIIVGFGAVADEPQPPLAIKGYDPVAYFRPGKPMPGSAEIAYEWDGARWQFADTAHRDLFKSDPEAFAPQYGGYCAMGMTSDKRGEIDPEAWTIVDGKLYLNFDRATRDKWRQNQAANIAQADERWAAAHEQ